MIKSKNTSEDNDLDYDDTEAINDVTDTRYLKCLPDYLNTKKQLM